MCFIKQIFLILFYYLLFKCYIFLFSFAAAVIKPNFPPGINNVFVILILIPRLSCMFVLSVLTLSLWNGFKKLPAISPSSRGVPGGLFMPAMLLGEFYKQTRRNNKNTRLLTSRQIDSQPVLPLATHPCHQSLWSEMENKKRINLNHYLNWSPSPGSRFNIV